MPAIPNKIRIGLYPGTFDPITNGHMDILLRSRNIVDQLIIAVSTTYNKNTIFGVEERCEMVNLYLKKYNITNDVIVMPFEGLLVNFARSVNANIIIRGLRALSDFEYEFQIACINSTLARDIETVFLPSSEKNHFISSSAVKEIARLSGDISNFVIPEVAEKLELFYKKHAK